MESVLHHSNKPYQNPGNQVDMFNIVLVHPQIPPNTGNIIRLCANNGCKLHLIEPLGFAMDEKSVRRAGMDYRDLASVKIWPDYIAFFETLASHRNASNNPPKLWSYSSKSSIVYSTVKYTAGDYLMFGSETAGLPVEVSQTVEQTNRLHIPMQENSRSLNLSNAVAIVSYEAWRQTGYQSPPRS